MFFLLSKKKKKLRAAIKKSARKKAAARSLWQPEPKKKKIEGKNTRWLSDRNKLLHPHRRRFWPVPKSLFSDGDTYTNPSLNRWPPIEGSRLVYYLCFRCDSNPSTRLSEISASIKPTTIWTSTFSSSLLCFFTSHIFFARPLSVCNPSLMWWWWGR